MELAAILRRLVARRRLVGVLLAVGVVVAIAVGLLASRAPGLGAGERVLWVASMRMLVDTADSQLVDVNPRAADTLPVRALIVADLVATDPAKAAVAEEAGVPPSQLEVLGPTSRAEPPVSTPLVASAAGLGSVQRAPYAVSLYADGLSPIVAIEGNAPSADRAAALAGAAASAIERSIAPRAGREPGFVAEALSKPSAEAVVHRPRRAAFALVAAAAAFALWCVSVVALVGGRPRSRRLTQGVTSPV